MNHTALAWIGLFVAGLFEFVWVIGMKYSDGFSRLIPSIICISGMLGSFVLLLFAVRHIPLGTAYAVWVGIGIVSVAIFGMVWLDEPATLVRIVCIFLILLGVVGLHLSGINEEL